MKCDKWGRDYVVFWSKIKLTSDERVLLSAYCLASCSYGPCLNDWNSAMQLNKFYNFKNSGKVYKKMKKNRLVESFACECVYMFSRMSTACLRLALSRWTKCTAQTCSFWPCAVKKTSTIFGPAGKSFEKASSTVARGLCMHKIVYITCTLMKIRKKKKITNKPSK